jgi:N6-adenosine-specific RNA methylase IME4
MGKMIDHPAAALMPMMSRDEANQLAADIIANGLIEPGVIFEGMLLDGRNRRAACEIACVEFRTRTLAECKSPTAFVLSVNRQRRHLTQAQLAAVAHEAVPMFAEEAKRRQREAGSRGGKEAGRGRPKEKGQTQNTPTPNGANEGKATHQAAKALNVSSRNVESVAAISKRAPEVVAALKSGAIATVADAVRLSRLDDEQRSTALERIFDGEDARKVIGAIKRQRRVENLVEISKGNADLDVSKTYPVIYSDPPWRYEHVKTDNRAIENQYPTMDLVDICALPVAELATPDAVLFMWATSPKLAESMLVIEAWGFVYRTCMVWIKDKIGMGYYARQRHELLLIATKGTPPTPEPSVRPDSVIEAPRLKHSAKPAVFAEMIETMYPEFPRVEMFCRTPRPGWDVWGNQS